MTATLPAIAIDANVADLARVRAFVRDQVAGAGEDAAFAADLVQAVDELVCNVIGHGYTGGPGRIDVAALVSNDAIAFRIRDEAPPFDPTAVPEPPLDQPLRERRLGGVGVHLAPTPTGAVGHPILPASGNQGTVRQPRQTARGASGGHHQPPA